MSGPLLELGRRAAARLPEDMQGQARMHLFDALAAAVAGSATREGGNAARQLAILADGHREPSPGDTVLSLARRIRATELDDLQLESVTTAGAAVIPALVGAMLVIGGRPRGLDDVLGAMAAGYDVMFTLGLAVGGPDFLYRKGGWPSLVGAGPAAAATTGRLLGLDGEGIAHAIALALLSTPRSLRGGEDGRWLSFGLAVTAGFHAALAACAGSRGDTGLLDADRDLSAGNAGPGAGNAALRARNAGSTDAMGTTAMGGAGLFAGLGAALARPWAPGCGLAKAHLKQWASAGQVAAAIDAIGQLRETHGFAADAVAAVDVHVPPAYHAMIDQPTGTGRLWSLLSAQYQIAVRLLYPQDLFDCARPVLRDSPGFLRVMRAVRVHDADSLAARHPQSYPARVAVTLAGGDVVDCLSDGRSPAPSWDWDSVLAKARAVAAHTRTEGVIERLREDTARSSNSEDFLLAAKLVLTRDDPAFKGATR